MLSAREWVFVNMTDLKTKFTVIKRLDLWRWQPAYDLLGPLAEKARLRREVHTKDKERE